MSETPEGGETLSVVRAPCPHCREPIDPAARACAHCRRDVTLDLLLTEPVLNPRQRYDLSRALATLSPKPALGEWVHRLQKGGVMLKGVTAYRAETILSVLGAASVVALTRAHRPTVGRKAALLILGGVLALGAAVAIVVSTGGAGPVAERAPQARAPAPQAHEPAPQARAPTPQASRTPLSSREVAALALPSVAVLRCGSKTGSGFFVSEHRLLTNEHMTCGESGLLAIELANGTKGEAHLVAADEHLDLALVETDLKGQALLTASAGGLAAGDTVMVAGAPLGLERTFHVGTVSNPRRVMLDVCYVQVDARINPGNSGGPVLDADGHAVAVVSMKQDRAEGIGFAVPIDYAFVGDKPLMPPPSWHPTRGFTAMLADVERDNEKFLQESKRLPLQLVRAVWMGRTQVVAALVAMAEIEPSWTLVFRFEQEAHTICNVSAPARWERSVPDRGQAKRTSDWMSRKGMGNVYTGAALLEVGSCQFERDVPIELILIEGDEKLNRTTL
ncbi:MAG TPA: S1C family serine protease [Polyangia bacterium]